MVHADGWPAGEIRPGRSSVGPERLQVVSVVSNKGGVGKTTVATNLAIFIRAIAEDLPILLIGLDDQTIVDRMFALDPQLPAQTSVEALLSGDLDSAVRPGHYGVHYVPSPVDLRELRARIRDLDHLRSVLEASGWRGLVIIDTKSDLDVLTRNAIAASDLTIAVVKDHQSLLEAKKVFDLVGGWGRPRERVRVLLSLVDRRVRYEPGETRDVLALLVLAIRERGYPLFETFISRSPKIESLYTNDRGSAGSILHDAPGSLIADQMHQLALDVLAVLRASRSGEPDVFVLPATEPKAEVAEAHEAAARRSLEALVAADPSRVLREAGLRTLAVDLPAPAGDTLAVVLQDAGGRVGAVVVGVEIPDGDVALIAQAIKSRAMVEILWGREHSGSRAFLIGDSISPRLRAVAGEYGVECFGVRSPASVEGPLRSREERPWATAPSSG